MMPPNNDDEAASLALAHQLQDEYDKLGQSTPLSKQEYESLHALDHAHPSSEKQKVDQPIEDSSAHDSNWRVMISDEEYAKQLQAEENATYTPPMSDEELARLLQMHEDGVFDAASTSFAVPPAADKKGKKPYVTMLPQPPSPPATPGKSLPSSAAFPSIFPFNGYDVVSQPPQIFEDPEPLRQWTSPNDPFNGSRNDPAIDETLQLAIQLHNQNREHSPTVFSLCKWLMQG